MHHIVVEAGKADVTLGREFTADEEQALHDAIVVELRRLDAIALATPRAVHVDPEFATSEVLTYDLARIGDGTFAGIDDDEHPFGLLDETAQTNAPLACPDCGRELQAPAFPDVRDQPFDYLICPRLAPRPKDHPCHAGDVVACGEGA